MDIIDAIDSATGCQQCGKDLAGSVSDDFCSEECQRTWCDLRIGETPTPLPPTIRAYRLTVGADFSGKKAYRWFGEANGVRVSCITDDDALQLATHPLMDGGVHGPIAGAALVDSEGTAFAWEWRILP